MKLLGNWLIAPCIVTTILYKLLRLVFISVQRIYWQFNGTAQKLRDARLPHNYQRSAHVLNVMFSHKFCTGQPNAIDNLLCIHNRFEDPQYIIDNENITLLTINERDAVFCETKDKDMRLWRANFWSFIRVAQLKYCNRVIVVPLTTFHRLAEQIGDPKGELIFLLNTARCGSTLLAQIMEHTGRCVSISEPNSPRIISTWYQKFGESAELRELARDVIRWECRPYPTMQPQPLGYFIKLMAVNSAIVLMIRNVFPSSRQLFMYRDIVAVSKSFYRISFAVPSVRLAYILGKISGKFVHGVFKATAGEACSDYNVRLDNDFTLGVVHAAIPTSIYLKMRQRGDDIRAVRYEDLVATPLDMCRVILEYCRFPVSLAELAVKGLEVDSQEKTLISRSSIGTIKEPDMSSDICAKLNELLKKYGIPLIGELGVLEGTMSAETTAL